jgi:eukaryotic-like serine/threonine-protein kinase
MAALSSERYVLLNRLADEFAERYRRGERPSLQEYLDRYPELADEIREYFPALAEVEQVKENRREVREPPSDGPMPPLQRMGDYRIIREIGHGGMGVVYEAEQVSLGRHVAVKVLPRQLRQDARTKSRFEREAKAAAKLHHTNIVPVFGVGEHDGLRYYVMQFIQGSGLDEVLEELKRLQPGPNGPVSAPKFTDGESTAPLTNVSTTDLARSLLTGGFVLAAEQEGNGPAAASAATVDRASGVAAGKAPPVRTPVARRHSDTGSLSSSSGMLPGVAAAQQSGKKRPTYWQSVARIGVQVAEALDHAHKHGVLHRDVKPSNLLLDNSGTVWVTDFGLAKVEDQQNLTETGDILGTLRYMPPEAFDGRADQRGDIYSLGLTLYELLAMRPAFDDKERNQLIRRVTTEEPPRLDKLNRDIPRDLVTIVHKAIDREMVRRYATAATLAGDLKRFLADEPIQARRVSPTERSWRWCRRNPVVAGLTVALALAFLAGFAGVTWKWRDAERQKGIARAAEQSESAQRKFAVDQANLATAEADRSRRLLYASDMSLAQQAWEAGDTGRARALLERQWPQAGQEDLRGFEWRYLWSLCQDGSRQTLRGHSGEVTAVVFSPDGKTLASTGSDRSIRLWDVASRRHVKLVGPKVSSVAFAPDGKTLALVGGGSQAVQLWDVAARCEGTAMPHPVEIEALAFSPDGKLLATCGRDPTVRIWDAATRQQLDTLAGHTGGVKCVAFSPDGTTLASGGTDNTARLWDVAARRAIATLRGHTDWVESLSFSPDGKTLASASDDTTVRLWDTAHGQPVKILRGHKTQLTSVAFSPDGKTFATGGGEGTVRMWDSMTKEVTSLLRGHSAPITAVAFAPDGRSLVSGSRDGTIKVWDIAARPDPNILTGHKAWLSSLALSPDGKTLAVSDADEQDNTVKLWDLASRQPVGIMSGHKRAVCCVAFAPNGQTLATGSGDCTVRLWDVATKEQLQEFPHDGGVLSVAFSPDGKLLAAGQGYDSVLVRDLATGHKVAELRPAYRVRFSPDGALMAASAHNIVRLWDVATWKPLAMLPRRTTEVLGLAFSPDSRTLATRDGGGTLWLWDLVQNREIGSSRGHTPTTSENFAGCVAFSPDGRRMATSGGDSAVKLWDVGLLQEVATLTGHDGPVYGVAFTPDGNTLATASGDTTARLWQAPPLESVLREPAGVLSVPPVETFRLFWLQFHGNAGASMATEGDVHRIDVTAVDGNDWHVQLCQVFNDLQEGTTYTVRFRARADAPRLLALSSQINEPDWRSIGLNERVPLSDAWRAYEFEFQAKGLARLNNIIFNVGERTGTVWIADFTLTKAAK